MEEIAARAASTLRQAVSEPTSRAVSAGTVNPGITTADVITLVSAMRGLIHTVPGATPDAWHRFLDLHLAGMPAVLIIPCGPRPPNKSGCGG